MTDTPGVHDAWQLQEAVNRGPFWQELQAAVARADAAEASRDRAANKCSTYFNSLHAAQARANAAEARVDQLTEALRETSRYLGSMPDAGLTLSDPRCDWYAKSKPLRDANDALLAVPQQETPND